MDLVTFLRERLDEDEMTAMAAGDSHPWHVRVAPAGYPQQVLETGTVALLCETYDGPVDNTGLKWPPVTANHIARHAPVRVLREVAAKRAIVYLHEGRWVEGWDLDGNERESRICAECDIQAPCPTFRHLAAVYADHPDYDQEWKP